MPNVGLFLIKLPVVRSCFNRLRNRVSGFSPPAAVEFAVRRQSSCCHPDYSDETAGCRAWKRTGYRRAV